MENFSAYFNSWSSTSIDPVGAVQIGTAVTFTFRVRLECVECVELVIQRDGSTSQALSMQHGEAADSYCTRFETSGESGLYFYHFRVRSGDEGHARTFFYGRQADDLGGEGRLLESLDGLSQYQLTCYRQPDPAPAWYLNGIIYHIFVDRFCNGNRFERINAPKANTFIYATKNDTPYYVRDESGRIARWDFYGGNLKGIICKLADLHRFGVTILYLSPIFKASSNHRYDTADYLAIDPMLGDLATFKKLVKKAKKLGMRILLDGVFNHVGADSVYFNRFGHYGTGGACQDLKSPYYSWFTFHDYPGSYDCWWNVDDLPTVNKAHPDYRRYIFGGDQSVIAYWTRLGVGGWRLDVADELPDDFIAGIRAAVDGHDQEHDGKVVIGEVWEDASNKLAYGKRHHYLEGDMLHGVMNYPLRTLIIQLVNRQTSAEKTARQLLTLKANYPPDAFAAAMNNIGTHDTERILTVLGGSRTKLSLAVQLLFFFPGVPCIYYGDEAGLLGGKDPDNRRFYPWQSVDQTIYACYREAIDQRRQDDDLRSGDFLPFSLGPIFACLRYRSVTKWTLLIVNPGPQEQTLNWDMLADETGAGELLRSVRAALHAVQTVAPEASLVIRSEDGSI
ncbi:MAG: glycoside hydrolase family 13 protein [Sporolactobacillus sp.]